MPSSDPLEDTDYTKGQIVKTFGQDALDFCSIAVSLGWRLVFNSTGTSLTLIPYDDRDGQRIHLSSRNKNQGGALRKRTRKLVRYGKPEMVKASYVAAELPPELRDMAWRTMQQSLPEDAVQVMVDEDASHDGLRKAFAAASAFAATAPTPPVAPRSSEPEPEPEESTPQEQVVTERHVVSTTPALMRRGRGNSTAGRSYPSETTTERTWSDGTIDYECNVCQAVSENRRAFGGSHWAAHVRRGEAKPVPSAGRETVIDPSYLEPAYSRTGPTQLSKLTSMLEDLDLATMSAEELAALILEHLGRTGGTSSGPSEPLSDAQLIERIRSMVDRGTYAKQVEQIREGERHLDELMQYAHEREQDLKRQLTEAEEQLAQTHLELTEAQGNMQTFYDLVQGTFQPKQETTSE